MIHVVIVDDEMWVCQLIKNIIDWRSLGFEIIEEAYDGEDGFQAILRHRPELVLTDIRMSGMDGIQLMQRIREEKIDTKFIVISGYNDFTYAQNALKFGAIGYLLKPIDRKELTDFLISIRDSLFADQRNQSIKKEMENKLDESLEQLRMQYFIKCLLQKEKCGSLEVINADYRCTFQPGCFQVMVVAVDEKIERNSDDEAGKTSDSWILQQEKEVLNKRCFEYLVLQINGFDVFILNYPEKEKEYIRRGMQEAIYRGRRGMVSEYDVTISTGCVVPDLCQIGSSYDRAVNGIQARIRYGTNQMIDISGKTYKNVGIPKIFSIEQEKRLVFYAETFDCMSARTLIKEILEKIKGDDSLNPELIFTVSEEILELFYKSMKRSAVEVEAIIGEKEMWIRKLFSLNSIERIASLLHKLLEEVKGYCEENGQKKSQKAVEVVKAYIAEHYKDDISLTEAAELVLLNPKYLGELFKKDTGLNYSEYLLKYRLDLAKEMLLDVRCRVGEVGEKVGYQDSKYFSRLFKKHVGVTPKQYKKMFS